MIRLTDLASNEEGGENDDKAKVSMERLMDAVIACEGIMVQQRIPFERTFCFRSPGRTGDGKSDYAGDAGKGGGKKGPVAEAESGCCREQQLEGWMKAKGEAKGAGKYKGKGEAKGTGKDEGKSKGEPQGCGKGEVKLRVEEIRDHTKITCEIAVYKITGDSWTRL